MKICMVSIFCGCVFIKLYILSDSFVLILLYLFQFNVCLLFWVVR